MKLDFKSMPWYKRVYWHIKLWHMDHRFPIWQPRMYILPPSYYYTHTEEECEAELQRQKEDLLRIIKEAANKQNSKGVATD